MMLELKSRKEKNIQNLDELEKKNNALEKTAY